MFECLGGGALLKQKQKKVYLMFLGLSNLSTTYNVNTLHEYVPRAFSITTIFFFVSIQFLNVSCLYSIFKGNKFIEIGTNLEYIISCKQIYIP